MTNPTACRAAFEKWMASDGSDFYGSLDLWRNTENDYVDDEVFGAWLTWQAAWNTRPAAVASHAEGEIALSYIIGQMRIQADHDFKNGLESASTRVGHWADELDRIRTLDPRWHIAGQVREKLDQACCPDHWMRVAVETITAMTIHCPPRSGDEARDAARYRWLRQPNAIRREAHIAVLTENGGYVATEEMADRAIDKAMERSNGMD